MIVLAGHRVVASIHAADQAIRRVPVLRGADRVAARYWVEQTVARALRDGRKAKRCPGFAVREWSNGFSHRARVTSEGLVRFVWNETETATFVVAHVKDELRGSRIWLVKTTIV